MGNCVNTTASTENKLTIDAEDLISLLNDSFENKDFNLSFYDTGIDFKSVAPCNRQICSQLITLFLVLLGVASLIAVTGNCAVFCCLLKKQTFLRPEMNFLFQFTLSNLIFALTLPFFTAYTTSGWQIGHTACRVIQGTYQAAISAAGLSLAFLASAYWFPEQMKKKPVLILIICFMWGIALAMLLLVSKSYGALEVPTELCVLLQSPDSQLLYSVSTTTRLCTSSLIPLISAAFLFWYTIQKTQDSVLKRQARLFASLMVMFAMLWTPFNVVSLLEMLNTYGANCEQQKAMDLGLEVTKSISILHCCVSPFLILIMKLRAWLYLDNKQ